MLPSRPWAGVTSGQISTSGTSYRRGSLSRTVPRATASGTGIAAPASRSRAAGSRSAASGPSNGAQPGNGITPSAIGAMSAYVSPSATGKPPIIMARASLAGRASAAIQASADAAECPATTTGPGAASTAASTAAI